jgi:hypothetical protein
MTDLKSQVYDLIRQFSGQANTLTIPRPFITMTGSLEAALLLSQILYWSDRSTMKDGWFAKTYGEWEAELTLTQYQISKAVKALKDFGVETKLKKFKDVPTLHYRINPAVFLNRVMKFFDNPGVIKNFDNPLTEPTKPTKDSPTGVGDSHSKPAKPKAERAANPMYDAIKDIWGYTAARNGQMAHLLNGTATKKGYAEYNLEQPITPDELRQWAAWYRQTALGGDAKMSMVEELIKVQSSITRWQELTADGGTGADDPFAELDTETIIGGKPWEQS